jgi:TP901 family phage tail tape measure protein
MSNVSDILLRLTGDNSSAIRAINQTIASEKQHLNQINQNIATLKNQSNAIQAQVTAYTNQRNSIQNNIQAVQSQNAVISNNIASLQNQKQAITGNTDADKQRRQAIDASINSLNAQKIANQNNINSLNAQKTALNGTIAGLNAQKTAINTNINSLNSQSQAINNNINSLQNQSKELSKSQGGFNLNTLAITAMSAATAKLAEGVASLSMEFDKQLRNVNSLVQASESQFKQFGESIKELTKNKDIVNSPVDLAKAMYQLVSSGFDAENSLKMIGVASKAASAGLTTTETSVTALSSLMNAYNKKTLKDSIEFSDQLFKVVDKGVISFEQLSSNLGSVNAVAAGAGVQFKEVGAAFIELTRAGISASESETAIANLIRSIADPSKEAADYAKLLGVELGDTALQTKGLSGVMADLSKATNGSLSIMSKLIPESRAAKAALNLAKDGASGFTRALGEMGDAAGSTDRALSQQSKSFSFQMQKMKQSLDVLKIEFGDIINNAMMPFISNIKYMIDGFIKLDKGTKESIVQVGFFAIALGGVLATMKLLNIAVGVFGGLLTKSNIALVAFLAFFYSLDKAITSVKNATSGWNLVLKDILENFNLLGQKINLLKGLESINLFGKVSGYIEYKKASLDLDKQENEQLDIKAKSLKTIQELIRKEKTQKLSSSEQIQYSQASTNLITFASNNEARKRLKDEALYRKKLADDLLKTETDSEKKSKELADKKSIDNKKRLENLEESSKKQEELEKERQRKQKQSDEDYKNFKIRLNDEVLKNKLSSMDYELAKLKETYDKDLSLAKTKADKDNINFVYQKERAKILNEYAKVEQQKQQELANKSQKINEDITNYVKDETQKRKAIEEKQQEELNKIALENYQRKQKQDKEALEDSLKLGEDETKAFEDQMQLFIDDENNSFDQRMSLLNDFIEYKKLKYGEDSKEYKSSAKQKLDIEKDLQAKQKQAINSFYSDVASGAVTLGNTLKNSSIDLVGAVGSLVEKTGEGFNSFLNMYGELDKIQKDLASGKINDITAQFQTMSTGAAASIKVVSDSLQNIFSNFDKQSNAIEKYKKAYNGFGADSQEVKDAILEMNEGVADSFKNLPGIIGEPLSKLARMFTDFIGFTESVAEKTRKALDAENFKKLVDETLKVSKKIVDSSNELSQLNIDLIQDENAKKLEQLQLDIRLVNQSEDLEAVKIAKIKKLNQDYNTWLNEYNQKAIDKEIATQKELNDKLTKENEDSLKKIQSINEANYKSELSILDKVYGEKRRKLEGEVQKEIDIIQSKNDRLKAIDDERNQTDADKKKRLQSFNQSLSSNKRTADFYRSNVEDFETGFGGISNQRKQLESDYQSGVIDYESYAKKRTEIGLKQFQYYTEQAKRISDPKEKQDILDKAYQGQQEYYDFIFDKEKEKVENETKQAETRLKTKRIELDKITELEKSEIAKLDQAYKDSSGLYRDSFVEATKVWTQFAQESINNIDLNNLINKVKNDVSQNKTEASKVNAKVNQIPGASNTGVNVPIKSGYSTGGNVGPLLPDGQFYSKDSSFNTSKSAESEQQKKNKLISKLVVNPMFDVPFDNFINQSLSWLENQAIRLGIPLMANGGVTKGLSIAGERGAEAIFNYGDMKGMYDFVKRTAISPSNSTNNYNQTPINITYSPVFTGVDLSKTGQVNEMIKSNFDTLRKDIIKAQGGR